MGWEVGVVERWNAFSKRKSDLFGFVDIVALSPKREGTTYLQVTGGESTGNAWARIDKIREECREAAIAILKAGNVIEVWSWFQVKLALDKRKRVDDAFRFGITLVGDRLVVKRLSSYRRLADLPLP